MVDFAYGEPPEQTDRTDRFDPWRIPRFDADDEPTWQRDQMGNGHQANPEPSPAAVTTFEPIGQPR